MPAEWTYVLNLGNSIIGVSILAMPYCLRQCGLILGLLLLFGSAYLTRISCNLLLKTAKQARRTSYEYLALHSFGSVGKLAVETSIIGLLLGTCIAFFVIIGDLGPAIFSKWFDIENTWSLRTVMLVLVAIFIVLPLGLLKKVEQLSSISALSFSFYTILIAQIILISLPTLISFSWVNHARYWRVEGLFHCLSIFSLAFTCHTQVFVVYESLPDRTERKMNDIVKGAVNMVAFCYIMVGFFGYVAFIEQGIKGDVLMNFKTSFVNDLLKFGFVVSVALSFPMMIMPCRASIYTLISGSQGPSLENPLGGGDSISQSTHNAITAFIVAFALMVGVAIPNVETILGLTGSTTGTMIGYIFPAIMFLKCLPKGPGVKSAQAVLFLGIIIMFASTYSTLQSRPDEVQIVQPGADLNLPDQDQLALDENKNVLDGDKAIAPNLDVAGKEVEILPDKRQEPPIPHAPADSPEIIEKQNLVEEKKEEVINIADKDTGEDEIQEKVIDVGDAKEEVIVKEVEDIQGRGDIGPDDQGMMEKGDDEEGEDEAHKRLEEKVELKVKEQDQKHEEQQKMIDELKEKQDIQEKVIEQQQEVIEELKKQHGESMENLPKADEGQHIDVEAGAGDVVAQQQQHVQARAVDPDNQANIDDPAQNVNNLRNVVPQQQGFDPQQQQPNNEQQKPAVPIVGEEAAKKMLADAQQLVADLAAAKKDMQVPQADTQNGNLRNDALDQPLQQQQHQQVQHQEQQQVQHQEQQPHEIKLPQADLIQQAVNQGLHNAGVQGIPKQPHPRDILEVDGKISEQEGNHGQKEYNHHGGDDGKDNKEEKAQEHMENEIKHEEARVLDSKERRKREEHGHRNEEREENNHNNRDNDEIKRDKREFPDDVNNDDNAEIRDEEKKLENIEDMERKMFEEHLENVMKANNRPDEDVVMDDNVEDAVKKFDADVKQIENAVREDDENKRVDKDGKEQIDEDEKKNEHLRKEEVRR
ncbi:uncharacterized protein LOC144435109 isoform X2 [Glandiceps talaboti]